MKNIYSKRQIKKISESPKPRILLNVCTHGTERVGLKVAEHFKNIKMLKGTFVINVANVRAVEKNIRFVTHDLNRVFPWQRKGELRGAACV